MIAKTRMNFIFSSFRKRIAIHQYRLTRYCDASRSIRIRLTRHPREWITRHACVRKQILPTDAAIRWNTIGINHVYRKTHRDGAVDPPGVPQFVTACRLRFGHENSKSTSAIMADANNKRNVNIVCKRDHLSPLIHRDSLVALLGVLDIRWHLEHPSIVQSSIVKCAD